MQLPQAQRSAPLAVVAVSARVVVLEVERAVTALMRMEIYVSLEVRSCHTERRVRSVASMPTRNVAILFISPADNFSVSVAATLIPKTRNLPSRM